MPQTQHTDSSAATRSTDELFLEMLCADEDLLRAEFDAIIAAEWPSPPPTDPDRDADAERRPPRVTQPRVATTPSPPHRPYRLRPDISGWTRQRSPPLYARHTRRQEGR